MINLETKIKELERKEALQAEELRNSFREFSHSLSPGVLIKSAMKNVVNHPGLRTTAIDTAISAGAGMLGRSFVVRGSRNIFRKIAGTAVQFIVANFVRNKMPEVKEKIAAGKNGVPH
jgi:hypothetical protein